MDLRESFAGTPSIVWESDVGVDENFDSGIVPIDALSEDMRPKAIWPPITLGVEIDAPSSRMACDLASQSVPYKWMNLCYKVFPCI